MCTCALPHSLSHAQHKSSWSNEHHGQDLSDTLFVQNNLACKCTGTKCICADASTDCDTIGGPQSATGYHTCEGGNLQEKHKDKCKGERAKGLYPKDGESTEDIWECGINHQNLCKYCFNYSRCPVCGPQVS